MQRVSIQDAILWPFHRPDCSITGRPLAKTAPIGEG